MGIKNILFKKIRGKREVKKKAIKSGEASSVIENEQQEDDDSDDIDDEIFDSDKLLENSDEVRELEQLKIEEVTSPKKKDESDSAFTLTYEAKTSEDTVVVVNKTQNAPNVLLPHPRRSSYIQFHKGYVYLYGGKFEDKDDKEITFNDMYTLSIKKLDEWKFLFEDKDLKLEELKKNSDSGKKYL